MVLPDAVARQIRPPGGQSDGDKPDHAAAVDQNRDPIKPDLVVVAELSGVAAHKRRGDTAGARAPAWLRSPIRKLLHPFRCEG